MMDRRGHRSRVSIVSFVIVLVLLASMPFMAGCSDSTAYDPAAAYTKAVQDASHPTPEKISRNLTAIVPYNRDLIWENGLTGSRVLVVAWVSQWVGECYLNPDPAQGCLPCKVGQECTNMPFDTWVTVVPEIKNFFRGASPEPLRVAQLLGLPPGASYVAKPRYMVEFWVSPKDLFRPCPDPEITDSECQLDFPADQFWVLDSTKKVYADQDCVQKGCGVTGDGICEFRDYKGWFTNRKDFIYSGSNPYPWTGLGYTYDWGNPATSVGLSEFVIHGKREDCTGVSVGIRSVTPTAAYFN
jgi:hypothetical protein